MQKELLKQEEILLVGIKVRTSNKAELDPHAGKIFGCVQKYFHGNLAEQILNRTHPGTTFCAYTEYESDHTGEYTYFIGEGVSSFDEIPEGLETLTIPAQTYVKFTNGPGSMPDVLRKPWEKIWEMSNEELGGSRAFHTDFEIYDERASDHAKIVLDILIGINKNS